jgi:hypothetical protein
MIEVIAVYNPRKSNGAVSDMPCDICGNVGAAYIELDTTLPDNGLEQHITYICKGCLDNWQALINKSILNDVMESVHRRKENKNV